MFYQTVSIVVLFIDTRVSSRIFCLGGGEELLGILDHTHFVGTLYWHVINLLIFMERSRHCPLKVTLDFQSQMLILTKQKQNGKPFVGIFSPSIDLNQGFRR